MKTVPILKVAAVIVASALIYYISLALLKWGGLGEYENLLRGVIIAVVGITLANLVGNAVITHLRPTIGARAYGVGNLVKVIGVLVAVFAALVISRVGAELAVVGGTVTGLVLGLALQPVLSNMFAGLLILGTRFVTVGDTVRIVTSQIPYQWTFLPGYKYFSPDYIAPGYKGKVVEIGLFYSTLVMDTGYELRVPNIVLLNSGVVDYTPRWSETQVVTVRVELPLSAISINTLQSEILSELEGFDVVAVDFTEQSDKDFVIIRVKVKTPIYRDWRYVKSEVLKRLLAYREKKLVENLSRYLCHTRGVMCDKLTPTQESRN